MYVINKKKQSIKFVLILWIIIPILYFVTLDYVNYIIDQVIENPPAQKYGY